MENDKLLNVTQAAEILGVTKWWFYQNKRWQHLPFTVLVSKRKIRFSTQGIHKYIESKQKENEDECF